jgi:hypothetical protein
VAAAGGFAVALHEGVLDAQVIEDAGDDEVDDLLDSGLAGVEAGRGGKDHAARAGDAEHVLDHDLGIGRLARHQDEAPPLLEADLRGPLDQVRRRPAGDAAERPAGAGDDRHAVGPVRPARDRDLEVLVVVVLDVGRLLAEKAADHAGAVVQVERDLELVVDDLLARLAYDEVDDGSGPGEAFEEPPSVGDAGASGDGEDEAALGHRTLFSATHCA